ncbi:MAG: 5'-3' exonuclease [Myxococcota bacterium]
MATVHLVDGTYELFRAWFALPSMRAPDGREVGAARGMLRGLAAWLRKGEVTHAAAAFDHVVESFRNALFDGYKTGEGLDPDLLGQFPLAERVTRALGLTTWPMVELEADDALATAAARLASDRRVDRVVLCSPDKDLCQCVRDGRVVVWDRFRDTVLDEDAVVAKFGVPPPSIPDYLALVGDAADGIPGVPRWGAKSAATVLARYGHVTRIPPDAGDWDVKVRGPAALARSLAEHAEDARLYVQLATLRTDAAIDAELAHLRWQGPDRNALRALCAELGEDEDRLRL